MIELLLNLLWVAIAIVATAVWRLHRAPALSSRKFTPFFEWTAFGCTLVLLFFVISLTDDLHDEIMFVEESSVTRRHSSCVTCSRHTDVKADISWVHTATPATHHATASNPLIFSSFVLLPPPTIQLSALPPTFPARAPPSRSL